MFKRQKIALAAGVALLALSGAATGVAAVENYQVGREAYIEAMTGKKVIFVPISQGMDLNQAWVAVWEREAKRRGYTLEVRDPNGSTEAGIRAITGAIADKPDVLIVQNPDVQTYARQLKQAQAEGIKVLQVNMQSLTQTDSYVGNDWYEMGRLETEELVRHCSAEAKGPSTKIVWLAGVEAGAANIYMRQAIDDVLKEHPEMQLVSDQAADYSSEKARAITETVLQQHPDLCGMMGIWDNAEVGAGAALKAAGKADQVTVVTNGAGSATACENIKNGLLDVVFSFNSIWQGEIAAQQIAALIQSDRPAGETKVVFFNQLTRVDINNANGINCWTQEDLK